MKTATKQIISLVLAISVPIMALASIIGLEELDRQKQEQIAIATIRGDELIAKSMKVLEDVQKYENSGPIKWPVIVM